MQNVFSTPLAPILVLWIGAVVFYVLDRFLEPQDGGVAEAVVLLLATVALLLVRSQLGQALQFGQALVDPRWRGTPPSLVIEHTTWVLALILLVTAGAAALASLVAPGTRRRASGLGHTPLAGRSGRVAALGATLLFLFGGDWATMALAWVLTDVFLLFALEEHSAAGESSGWPAGIRGWTAFLSLGGAVALGLALVVWQGSAGSGVGRGSLAQGGPLPGPGSVGSGPAGLAVAGLVGLAGVLRLLPFPLPEWQGESSGRVSSPLTRLMPYLVPVLCGAYLWTCLSPWNVAGQDGTGTGSTLLVALSLWAGLAMLVSALKAWTAPDPGRLIACTSTYGIAFVLLGAGLALPASWQQLVGASAVLSVCGLYVSWTQCQYLDMADPGSYWRVAPTGVAVLSLIGLPLTVGFPARVAVYHSLFERERWLVRG